MFKEIFHVLNFNPFWLYIKVVILESGLTNPQLGLRALSKALSQKGIAKNISVCFDFLLYHMAVSQRDHVT